MSTPTPPDRERPPPLPSSLLPPPLPGWGRPLDDGLRGDRARARLRAPTAGAGDVGDLRTEADLRARRVLSWCCVSRTPALLSCAEPPQILAARFGRMEGDEVLLRIDAPFEVARAALVGGPDPCVLFSQERRSTAFHARVREVTREEGEVWARVAVPAELTSSDSRSAARVRVSPGAGLTTRLHADGRDLDATTMDLSLTGARLVLTDESSAPHAGARIGLTLALDGLSVNLAAQVRRRRGAELGVLFPDCVRDGVPRPPEELVELLRSLDARRARPLAAR